MRNPNFAVVLISALAPTPAFAHTNADALDHRGNLLVDTIKAN
jgi:hypothetical protein